MLRRCVPFIVVCTFISWLSHLPASDLPLQAPFPGFDKIAHIVLFVPVGLTAFWAVPHRWVGALVLALGFALFDELHQAFVPGRHSDVADFLADGVGVLLGLRLFWARAVPIRAASEREESS